MRKGLLLSLFLLVFAALLQSCGGSLQSAADIDKTLDALEQTVKESENTAKAIAGGDFDVLSKIPDLAVKYNEQYSALQQAESKMSTEQKERLANLVKRFNAEGDSDVINNEKSDTSNETANAASDRSENK